MSIERISTIQTASVITQPTGATERLTLIEKLEQEVKRLLELKAQEKPHSLGYVFLGHHIAATVNAINIVKQHEAESGWVSVKTPPPKRGNYLVYTNDYRMFDCRYSDGWHKNTIGYKDILYWKPIQPPSEVQDD